MNSNLFEPMELIEPLPLESELGNPDEPIVRCADPGYVCWVGDKT